MPAAQIADESIMSDPLRDAIEIIPNRLYFTSLGSRSPPPNNLKTVQNQPIHFFNTDNELIYWNFFLDFGPLNLGQLYRFCTKLNYKLKLDPTLSQKAICYYSSNAPNKCANAVYLICAWQVLYMDRTPEEAFNAFRIEGIKPSQPYARLPPFHDASPCRCTYDLTVLDCLHGLAKARMYRYFDFDDFDVEEYEYFEQVENGDLNWIMKDKILAFAGPQHKREMSREGYCTLTPEDYIPYFLQKNIGIVVRLNKRCYAERKFISAGINHSDHYYLDGSVPQMKILQSVLTAFESVPKDKGFAVHCKAGLGRTGTCIGAYMMKHYKFTAAEAIGWMRICRPGSVIGPQQHFLQDIEQQMWHDGDVMRLKVERSLNDGHKERHVTRTDEHNKKRNSGKMLKFGGVSKLQFGSLSVQDQMDAVRGRVGQADELLARRVQVQAGMDHS